MKSMIPENERAFAVDPLAAMEEKLKARSARLAELDAALNLEKTSAPEQPAA